MRILITGADGFLGKYVAKRLEETSLQVFKTSRKRKPSTPNEYFVELGYESHVEHVMKEVKPTHILHFAANPSTKFEKDKTASLLNDNVVAVQRIANAAPAKCHIIYASSILVYGDTPKLASENTVCRPTSLYGATKLASEAILNAYALQGLIKVTNLRLSALVGPNLRRGMLFDVINKLKSGSAQLDLFGDCPGAKKPVVHLEDVSAIIDDVIDREIYGTFNVCTRDSLTVEDVAHIAMDQLGIRKSINWLGSGSTWVGDNNELKISNKRLTTEISSLIYDRAEDAIAKTVRQN